MLPTSLPSPSDRPEPKIKLTTGSLPRPYNPIKPPNKKMPFSAMSGDDMGFVSCVQIVISHELFERLSDRGVHWGSPMWDPAGEKGISAALRVMMKLEDWLEEEIFEELVKKGDILILSEGRPGVDNLYSLKKGILRLELDKETYERAGLQGAPCQGGGRKHVKARYVVELDLKLPCMRPGNKGFDGLVRAAKTVLNNSLTWLFFDVGVATKKADHIRPLSRQARKSAIDANTTNSVSPLDKFHPINVNFTPQVTHQYSARVPPRQPPEEPGLLGEISWNEWTQDIVEWLSLVSISSPRVREGSSGDIAPLLCRWEHPDKTSYLPTLIRYMRWHGLVDPGWVRRLFITCMIQSTYIPLIKKSDMWLSMTVHAHPSTAVNKSDGYTILMTPNEEYPVDEVAAAPQAYTKGADDSAEKKPPMNRRGKIVETPTSDGLCNFACFQFSNSVPTS